LFGRLPLYLLEDINLIEAHFGKLRLIGIDANLGEVLNAGESIFILSGLLNKLVGQNLNYFCPTLRSISKHLPLV